MTKNIPLSFFMAGLLFTLNISYAEETSQSCETQLQEMVVQLQNLQITLKNCLATKSNQLNSFKDKRQQYLRLVSLVERYHDIFDENDALLAIKEKDILLASKLKDYEICVGELALIKLPDIQNLPGSLCADTLSAGKMMLHELEKYGSQCRKCSIATIGEGYDKSPIEILVDQTNESRRLRDALYNIVSQENAKLVFENKTQSWQLIRDIVVPHIEDVASELAVSPVVLELLEWLGDSVDFRDGFDAGTDAAMSAYTTMIQLLKSKPNQFNPLVLELRAKLSAVVSALPDDFSDLVVAREYAGQDPSLLTQGVLQLNDEQRKVLVKNINSAVKLYGKWK